MIDILIGTAGAIIIVLVASDIFRSLLVPRASNGILRLGPLLTRAIFPVWQVIANCIPGSNFRQTMRASLAPLILLLSLILWAATLIFGFGLVFWATRSSFTPRFVVLGDAVYAAGSAFATRGIGESASGHFARTAVVGCSLAGLAIVTVVATFLISIQAAFGQRETLVLRLESHVTLPPAGIAILETYAREDIKPRLGVFFDAWEAWAAEVAISHRSFPILLFFRSNDCRCEWLAALGAVLDAAALLDAAVADASPEVRAGAHFALRTGARLLRDMADELGIGDRAFLNAVDAERFHDDCDRLGNAGYTLVGDQPAALIRFTERREAFAPALRALSRRLHVDVDERRARVDGNGSKLD